MVPSSRLHYGSGEDRAMRRADTLSEALWWSARPSQVLASEVYFRLPDYLCNLWKSGKGFGFQASRRVLTFFLSLAPPSFYIEIYNLA